MSEPTFRSRPNPIHPHLDDNILVPGQRIRFPEGNTIQYYQDFGFPRGVPHDVIFTVRKILSDGNANLTAPGYGEQNPPGHWVDPNEGMFDLYGNGAIIVSVDEILRHCHMVGPTADNWEW
jgi:hypothetical protein